MRRTTSLVLAAALLLGACSEASDLVDQAQTTVDDVRSSVDETLQTFAWCSAAFRLGAAVTSRDVEAARSAATDLEANAPDELQDELAVVLAAVEDAEAGDVQAAFTPEVRAAGETVLTTARDRCDPTTDPTA